MYDRIGKILEQKRIARVLPHVRGELLDLGCGPNNLVKEYGRGIGVDVFDWGGGGLVVEDTSKLPFGSGRFGTVAIIAALNHIPNRREVLKECQRVLQDGGRLVVTMIPPVISKVWHKLRSPWDSDQKIRGMKEGELYGIGKWPLVALVEGEGFKLRAHRRFMLFVNSLYVFEKI